MEEFKLATFAGGCFWCLQPPLDQLEGVVKTTVGYSNGHMENPSYEQVCSGVTGHTEAIQVVYDETKVSYETLLGTFWKQIDPFDDSGQFADRGSSYKTAIFYHDETQRKLAEQSKSNFKKLWNTNKEIAVKILPYKNFYAAEEEHQKYYKKNPIHYNAYKIGSGRDDFIHTFWKDKNDTS